MIFEAFEGRRKQRNIVVSLLISILLISILFKRYLCEIESRIVRLGINRTVFFFFFYTRGSRNLRNKVLEHWFIVVQSIISIAWKLIFIRYPSLGRDDGGV